MTAPTPDKEPTILEWTALGIGTYGAGLSTLLAISKRRRKLIVKAGFGAARLGDLRNHALRAAV